MLGARLRDCPSAGASEAPPGSGKNARRIRRFATISLRSGDPHYMKPRGKPSWDKCPMRRVREWCFSGSDPVPVVLLMALLLSGVPAMALDPSFALS